ncbi:hypothetical protein ACQW02_20870 [Humitalea sp. 24SJ18S-53]|uniref:hypothetical protein n=1 Tax=Humitalea sp. 24SJ18S-53 TaxID=3422307 RepID=UPI003D667AF6
MTLILRPTAGDSAQACATRAMPHSQADRMLEDAWADPWTRASFRATAAGVLPTAAFLDDSDLLLALKHQVMAGLLQVADQPAFGAPFGPGGGGKGKASQAPRLIDEFSKRGGAGVFPHISRADVVAGLRERLADKKSISQKTTSLCGPSALCTSLLHDDPDVYVTYVISVWETGVGKLGTIVVKPGEDCRNYKPKPMPSKFSGKPRNFIAPVDWVALASLRDSENDVFDYDDDDDAAGGITMPEDLAEWFTKVGYRDQRNETNIWFTKGAANIDEAGRLRSQGYAVALFICANMIQAKSQRDHGVFTIPDHWILLNHTSGFTQGSIDLNIWSWGGDIQVPDKGRLSEDDFSGNYFGYVAARPG